MPSELEKIENQIMAERRKRKRYQLIFNIAIVDLSTEEEIGWLINISSHGFMLSSHKEIEDEVLPNLTLRLPDDIDMHEDIIFEAHVCWTKPDANPDYQLIGFKVTDDLEKYSTFADALIEKFGVECNSYH